MVGENTSVVLHCTMVLSEICVRTHVQYEMASHHIALRYVLMYAARLVCQ
jgi:hypothetical protein